MAMYLSMLETGSDRIVFQKLYEENRKKLYFIAWKILQNVDDAEDAVHTCFWKLAENFSRYNRLTYVELVKLSKTMVRNAASDIARGYEKKGSFPNNSVYGEDGVADVSPDVLEQLIAQYDSYIIAQALMQLTEEERELLYLQYGLGLKPKAIGALLGVSSEMIRKKMLRCRNKLAKILAGEAYKNLR